jgi:hypothetical protein
MTDDLLPSLTDVTATRDIGTPYGVIPAGTAGTIVSHYDHVAYLVEFEAPWYVVAIPHDLVAAAKQPLSREQIVANELRAYIELAKPLAQWANDDWLEFARHMIKTVEVARDISAEEATAAIHAPWPKDWPLLPKFDEL